MAIPPWLIQAGLSIVGGALTARAQRGANDTDLVKLRKEANRSGFHPLTVLRATGGAGFTRGVHGGLSRMGALFSGASRMVGAYNANQRQIVDDAYNAEFRSLQLQGMRQDIKIGKRTLANMVMQADFSNPKHRNEVVITETEAFGKTAETPKTTFTDKTAMTSDGMRTMDEVKSGWFPMALPWGGHTISIPWDPEEGGLDEMAGGAIRLGGIEIPAMAYFSGQKWAKDKMQRRQIKAHEKAIKETYWQNRQDQVRWQILTGENVKAAPIRIQTSPPLSLNHLMRQ